MSKEVQRITENSERQVVQQFQQGFYAPGLVWPRTSEIVTSEKPIPSAGEEFVVDVGDILVADLRDNQKINTTCLVSCVGVALSLRNTHGSLYALAHLAYSIDDSLGNIVSELKASYSIDDMAISLPTSAFQRLSYPGRNLHRLFLQDKRLFDDNRIYLREENEVGGMEVSSTGVVFTRRVDRAEYLPVQEIIWAT